MVEAAFERPLCQLRVDSARFKLHVDFLSLDSLSFPLTLNWLLVGELGEVMRESKDRVCAGVVEGIGGTGGLTYSPFHGARRFDTGAERT